jgi:hypothetical protein
MLVDMARADPAKRPTIDRVVACFADIQKGLSVQKLRARVLGGSGASISAPVELWGAGIAGFGPF